MNILNWAQKAAKPKKKVNRQKIISSVAKKGGPIGNIARQRKKHDKALEDIMKGM